MSALPYRGCSRPGSGTLSSCVLVLAFGLDEEVEADVDDASSSGSDSSAMWSVSVGVGTVVLGAATLLALSSARGRRGTRHPRVGALLGLDVAAVIAAWVILVPRFRDGDFYEASDPLIYLSLPMVIVGTAIGATVGSLWKR